MGLSDKGNCRQQMCTSCDLQPYEHQHQHLAERRKVWIKGNVGHIMASEQQADGCIRLAGYDFPLVF